MNFCFGYITVRSNPGEQETQDFVSQLLSRGMRVFLVRLSSDFISFPPPFFVHTAQQ